MQGRVGIGFWQLEKWRTGWRTVLEAGTNMDGRIVAMQLAAWLCSGFVRSEWWGDSVGAV